MGYRLEVTGFILDEPIIRHKFYGTKFYGYLRGEETELLSFKYLVKINKFSFDDTYFGYSEDNKIFLNYDEFITFILLYDFDLKHDKEVKHEYNILDDKDILELMNTEYEIYKIQWC